jgi:hypothetical protein
MGQMANLQGPFRLYGDPLEAARQGPANQVFAALAAMAGIVVLAAAVRRRHGNQQKDKMMSTRKSIRDAGVRAILATAFTLFAAAGVAQAQSFAKAPGSPYTSAPPTGNGVAVAVGDFNNVEFHSHGVRAGAEQNQAEYTFSNDIASRQRHVSARGAVGEWCPGVES